MIKSRFAQRSEQTEIMDDLNCEGEVLAQTLRELEVINLWLGGNKVTLSGLDQLLKTQKGEISIADIGCGGGDMLKVMAKWARKKGYKIKFTGIDANDFIINYAKENTKTFPEVDYQCHNVFSEEFQAQQFDVITCTLFTHHFKDDELITLLTSLGKQAKLGIVINDLHRHWFAYHSIKTITGLFSKSPMVQNDAPISVLRGFSKANWQTILQKASISTYSLVWKWAFRWRLVIMA